MLFASSTRRLHLHLGLCRPGMWSKTVYDVRRSTGSNAYVRGSSRKPQVAIILTRWPLWRLRTTQPRAARQFGRKSTLSPPKPSTDAVKQHENQSQEIHIEHPDDSRSRNLTPVHSGSEQGGKQVTFSPDTLIMSSLRPTK
jgi:hypothetical protein